MARRCFAWVVVVLCVVPGGISPGMVQDSKSANPIFRVNVDLVQLDVAVTDHKGHYVTALRPQDFRIFEDGIPQKVAFFEEANQAPRRLMDAAPTKSAEGSSGSPPARTAGTEESSDGFASLIPGASVFVLFDTSNYMYQGFVFAQDAIGEFVRSLDRPARVAFYSYSRDFSRAALLSPDRSAVLRGVRATVAGDDAALYNALLLTLKDASIVSGRKVVVVFSNGPDNASMVAPEDVRELAQSEGVTIYMISSQEAKLDVVSSAVFRRMSDSTGGKAYFAKNWEDQKRAFASIRDDLAHLYSFSYYPQPNPNRGWRTITVKLIGGRLKRYHIRTRSGYRPKGSWLAGTTGPSLGEQPN